MGGRIHIQRLVARLCAAYLAILVVLLAALDAAAYAYVGAVQRDLLRPILSLPEGRAAYAAVMHGVAVRLVVFDLPLLGAAGAAAYALAAISVRPLAAAREREARFAADAAHELRTPLARIAALAQRGRRGDGDLYAPIEAAALDAARTVSDLLALVREERIDPRLREPVELRRVVSAVVAEREVAVPAVAIAAEGEFWIDGDPRRIRRLVENVVDNALRHARSRVTIELASRRQTVVLTIEDDGDGVAPAIRERLFERFSRGAEGGSAGLGLAISRGIARAHGGDLRLEARSRFVAEFRAAEHG